MKLSRFRLFHSRLALRAAAIVFLAVAFTPSAWAHCDTLDGPVVLDAKLALEKGDLTPVMKWVKKGDEAEIRSAFQQTLAVRAKGAEARELADRYFFETVVRVHRAGEGAPYSGLKPAGTDFGPAIAGADKAVESGSAADVEKLLVGAVREGLNERFEQLKKAREHAPHSVEAGRVYTAAYADFIHYVERLYDDASKGVSEHEHKE